MSQKTCKPGAEAEGRGECSATSGAFRASGMQDDRTGAFDTALSAKGSCGRAASGEANA